MQITINKEEFVTLMLEAIKHKNLILEERQGFQVSYVAQDSETTKLVSVVEGKRVGEIVINKNTLLMIEKDGIVFGKNKIVFYNKKLTTTELINTLSYLREVNDQ